MTDSANNKREVPGGAPTVPVGVVGTPSGAKHYIGRWIFRYRWSIYMAVFIMMAIPLKWWAVFSWMTETEHWSTWVVGGIVTFIGAAIRIYAAFYIGWKGKERILTTDGPYRYTRNPLYWGNIIGFAGAAILFKLLWYIPIAVGVIWLLHHILITWYEETRMREKYGAAYKAYCKTTPRWGPKLSGFAKAEASKEPFPWSKVYKAEMGTIGGFIGAVLVAVVKELYFK